MLLVTAGCVYAPLLSGYSGIGVGGLTVRNDPSLRSLLGLAAICAWTVSVVFSAWAIRISRGLGRAVPAVPLVIAFGVLTFVVLGAIF